MNYILIHCIGSYLVRNKFNSSSTKYTLPYGVFAKSLQRHLWNFRTSVEYFTLPPETSIFSFIFRQPIRFFWRGKEKECIKYIPFSSPKSCIWQYIFIRLHLNVFLDEQLSLTGRRFWKHLFLMKRKLFRDRFLDIFGYNI